MGSARRLEGLDHALARAVFRSVYASRAQRRRRLLAGLLLGVKHTLRGMLFIWPLYLMAVAGFFVPATIGVFLWLLVIPGIGLSLYILARGVCDDYRGCVAGRMLAHVLERLAPQVERVVLGSNAPPAALEQFGMPVLPDILGGFRGPLAGTHAALQTFPDAEVVSVAVDPPLLPRNLVARLKAGWNGARCRYATCGARHALAILWPPGMAGALAGFLARQRSVADWLDRHGRPVALPAQEDADLCLNINTPADPTGAGTLVVQRGR